MAALVERALPNRHPVAFDPTGQPPAAPVDEIINERNIQIFEIWTMMGGLQSPPGLQEIADMDADLALDAAAMLRMYQRELAAAQARVQALAPAAAQQPTIHPDPFAQLAPLRLDQDRIHGGEF